MQRYSNLSICICVITAIQKSVKTERQIYRNAEVWSNRNTEKQIAFNLYYLSPLPFVKLCNACRCMSETMGVGQQS